jgi:ubiquinone/menaquinone biosynthesis C-methylase UbiE
MKIDNFLDAVEKRYSSLASQTCCLSCGNAAAYAGVQNGETVCDLGSGRGTDVLKLAEQIGESGMAYGLDISSGMLETAEKTAKRLGYTNAVFLQSNLIVFPLQDVSIDVIVSNCTLNHVQEKQKTWDEIFRVLKKEGRFVISDIYATAPVPQEFAADEKCVSECWGGAVTKDEYLHIIKNSGFSEIRIIEESDPYKKSEVDLVSFTIAGIKSQG